MRPFMRSSSAFGEPCTSTHPSLNNINYHFSTINPQRFNYHMEISHLAPHLSVESRVALPSTHPSLLTHRPLHNRYDYVLQYPDYATVELSAQIRHSTSACA